MQGKITGHFLLQNTGRSNVFGIKFKPTALTHLFDLNMRAITDKVINAVTIFPKEMSLLQSKYLAATNSGERIGITENYFKKLLAAKPLIITYADKAIDLIFEKKGMITVAELCATTAIG